MNPDLVFTISARGKYRAMPVLTFLDLFFGHIPRAQIDSVFGFVEPTPLYGGRPFFSSQLSDRDAETLYGEKIGVRIPLTNHYVSDREYEMSRPFFEKYHREGNSLIIFNDGFARRIRRDYPKFRLEASVIKNINTHEKIAQALDDYDTVVLPMHVNDDTAFLGAARPKERITLFGNAGCAYNCLAKICYEPVSRVNKLSGSPRPYLRILGWLWFPLAIRCSRPIMRRRVKGLVNFDIDKLAALGYTRFKIMRVHHLRRSCH